LIILLLAGTLILPFPFSHIIPALVIMLVSFAYLEEDGALLCISLAAALALSLPKIISAHSDGAVRRELAW